MQESFVLELGKEDRIIRGDVVVQDTPGSKPTIILLHGFKGFKDWGFLPTLAQRLTKKGFAVVSFNFSMNGIGEDLENYTELEKFGRLTFSREQEDIAFVLQQMKLGFLPFSSYMDLNRIGLFGHSRGGGNSILFAVDHPEIKAVAVWNSIYRVNFFDSKVVEDIEQNGVGYISHARTGQQMPIYREVLADIESNREKYDILKRLTELHCPLLIVQGDHDHPGLVEGAPLMAQAAPHATLHTVQGANHTMGIKHPAACTTTHFEEAVSHTLSFYLSHLKT